MSATSFSSRLDPYQDPDPESDPHRHQNVKVSVVLAKNVRNDFSGSGTGSGYRYRSDLTKKQGKEKKYKLVLHLNFPGNFLRYYVLRPIGDEQKIIA